MNAADFKELERIYKAKVTGRGLASSQHDIAELQEKIALQSEKLREQDELLKILVAPPFARAMVISMGTPEVKGKNSMPGTVLLSNGAEVLIPPKMELKPGMTVRLSSKTMEIVSVVGNVGTTAAGVILTVVGVVDDSIAEVEVGGATKAVGTAMVKVAKGDRVIVDNGMSVVIQNLGKQQDTFKVEVQKISVTWDSIGGQAQAKAELQEAIEGPFKHPEIFKAYGKKTIKGILLEGPPGCGKTMFAKAAATAIARQYGEKSASGFISVKGPEILNKYVGQSEETIRGLFVRARDHYKKHHYPAILFIDECDAILGARGSHGFGMEKTTVPMFLAEMDGMEEGGPLVLLATNRADTLDPAIVRDGRVDRKISVQRPTKEDSIQIFEMYLRNKPIDGIDRTAFATAFAEELFISPLVSRVSGALIAGLVDQAVSIAMRRDIAAGISAKGLNADDIMASIKTVEIQNEKVK